MAETMKSLAQITPAATTLTAAYTVPALTTAVISTITVCNQGASTATFRIAVAVAGAADNTKQYLYYDCPLAAKATFAITLGITLAATDIVRVYASSATMSFNIFGSEVV